MKKIAILIGFILSMNVVAETTIKVISPKYCSEGEQAQPNGRFAIYIFCDDALGTNIAVFMKGLGAPFEGDYQLGKRFWQGQEWAYDVTSYAWLPDNQLLIATSAIYGSGSIYLLNLEKQSARVLFSEQGAELELESISGSTVNVRYETTPGNYKHASIEM